MPIRCLLALVLAGVASGQPKDDTFGARGMFYEARSEAEDLPPVPKAKVKEAPRAQPPAQRQTPRKTKPVADNPGVLHLGIRYNLVLLDKTTGAWQAVDSNRIFSRGDCFAIDFETNRAGYLYVLAQQSSGNWAPLFPSPEMIDESNVVRPGVGIRVPRQYCFELRDPPGSEKLFVILSRDPNEIYDLHEGIRQESRPAPPPRQAVTPPREDTFQVADARVIDSAVARMAEQSGSRDIAITKVDQPVAAQEPAFSVYVVSAPQKPSSRVVTRIEVRHR